MATALLSKTFIASASCPSGLKKYDVFDQGCKGLLPEIRPTGYKAYYLRYTDQRGKQRQLKIADARDLSLEQARKKAEQLRAQIALGNDPSAEKKIAESVPTLAEFALERYLPNVKGYKKSWRSDVSYLNNQILPVLGKKHLDELTRKDVIDFHHGLKAKGYKPGTCNRSLILVRYAMNLAIKWETPGIKINPTKDVPLFDDPDGKRDRFLTQEETARLFEAVQKSPNPMLQFIIPMLILTGSRKREVLDAKWEDFDLDRSQWRIPTTKAGRPRYVPISKGVITLLASIPRNDCSYVFANPKTKLPYVSIFNGWNTARKQAGLAEVRIHDLRHSFASFLINGGRSIYEVKRILGHTQIKTTQRYAHLSHDTLLDAANVAFAFTNQCLPGASITPEQLGYRKV